MNEPSFYVEGNSQAISKPTNTKKFCNCCFRKKTIKTSQIIPVSTDPPKNNQIPSSKAFSQNQNNKKNIGVIHKLDLNKCDNSTDLNDKTTVRIRYIDDSLISNCKGFNETKDEILAFGKDILTSARGTKKRSKNEVDEKNSDMSSFRFQKDKSSRRTSNESIDIEYELNNPDAYNTYNDIKDDPAFAQNIKTQPKIKYKKQLEPTYLNRYGSENLRSTRKDHLRVKISPTKNTEKDFTQIIKSPKNGVSDSQTPTVQNVTNINLSFTKIDNVNNASKISNNNKMEPNIIRSKKKKNKAQKEKTENSNFNSKINDNYNSNSNSRETDLKNTQNIQTGNNTQNHSKNSKNPIISHVKENQRDFIEDSNQRISIVPQSERDLIIRKANNRNCMCGIKIDRSETLNVEKLLGLYNDIRANRYLLLKNMEDSVINNFPFHRSMEIYNKNQKAISKYQKKLMWLDSNIDDIYLLPSKNKNLDVEFDPIFNYKDQNLKICILLEYEMANEITEIYNTEYKGNYDIDYFELRILIINIIQNILPKRFFMKIRLQEKKNRLRSLYKQKKVPIVQQIVEEQDGEGGKNNPFYDEWKNADLLFDPSKNYEKMMKKEKIETELLQALKVDYDIGKITHKMRKKNLTQEGTDKKLALRNMIGFLCKGLVPLQLNKEKKEEKIPRNIISEKYREYKKSIGEKVDLLAMNYIEEYDEKNFENDLKNLTLLRKFIFSILNSYQAHKKTFEEGMDNYRNYFLLIQKTQDMVLPDTKLDSNVPMNDYIKTNIKLIYNIDTEADATILSTCGLLYNENLVKYTKENIDEKQSSHIWHNSLLNPSIICEVILAQKLQHLYFYTFEPGEMTYEEFKTHAIILNNHYILNHFLTDIEAGKFEKERRLDHVKDTFDGDQFITNLIEVVQQREGLFLVLKECEISRDKKLVKMIENYRVKSGFVKTFLGDIFDLHEIASDDLQIHAIKSTSLDEISFSDKFFEIYDDWEGNKIRDREFLEKIEDIEMDLMYWNDYKWQKD